MPKKNKKNGCPECGSKNVQKKYAGYATACKCNECYLIFDESESV